MAIVSIGFSKPKKWKLFAELIMWAEGTNYSHTFISWKDINIKRRKVFEAVGAGVRILGNVQFKLNAHVVEIYKFEIPNEDLVKLEQFSHDNSGKPYGFKHILGLSLMRVCKLFGVKISNPYKDGDYSQICVETGSYVLKNFIDIEFQKDIEDYALIEYHDVVQKYGEKISQEKLDIINNKEENNKKGI